MTNKAGESFLSVMLTVVLAVCAVATTGLVVRRELGAGGATTARQAVQRFEKEPNWRDYAVGDLSIGEGTAPVVVVEFGDYQCPACRQLDRTLRTVLGKPIGREVRLVYRHYPITTLHAAAFTAALASECAASQGRFQEMHNTLFDSDSLGTLSWRVLGARAGVPDLDGLETCISEGRFRTRVQEDIDAGERLGVRGTPTVLINDTRFVGAVREAILDSLLTAAAERARRNR